MLSRYAHHIHQVHIADGFLDDCDEIIHKCLQFQTLHFQTFCEVWKDMQFGMIYQGRSSGAEIAELSEEVIHFAKQYMVKHTTNFEESVAGLFLVYGLVTLQPFRGFAWLRIIPDDVPAINRIQVVARRERRLDVLYILGELLIKHSQYHADERDRGMESSLRKYLEGYTSIDKLGVRPRGVFYRQNEELDIIRDLNTITKQYMRAKSSLISQSDTNLQYIDENLASELNGSLKRVINGLIENDDDSDDENNTKDHSESVQAIKLKAMSNTINSMKHLTGVAERKPGTSSASPKKKSDIKSKGGKIKTNSPTKPATNSPKKQKTIRKKNDTEYIIPDTNDDLNLVEFNKVNNETNEANETCKNGEANETQGIEIELDTLPVAIHSEVGKEIEIEFIDNCTIANEKPDTDQSNNEIESNSGAKKRKHPRSRIKSKFKKMGMLPIANFNEKLEK